MVAEAVVAAAAESTNSAQLIFQFLSSGAVVAVITVMITGVVNRKRLGAEATSIITQAAGGMVKTLQDDNARLRVEQATMRVERDAQEARERERDIRDDQLRKALERHEQWDRLVTVMLREAGLDVPTPPTLTASQD